MIWCFGKRTSYLIDLFQFIVCCMGISVVESDPIRTKLLLGYSHSSNLVCSLGLLIFSSVCIISERKSPYVCLID